MLRTWGIIDHRLRSGRNETEPHDQQGDQHSDRPDGRSDGTVYCANVGNDTVTEYKRGRNAPSLTIQLPNSDNPEDLAVDAKNNLYVSHPGGSAGGGVLVFAPGKTTGNELGLVIGDPGGSK